MTNKTFHRAARSSHWTDLCLALFLILISAVSHAQNTRIIDNIDVDERADKIRLQINFNVPLQYITHAPASRGDEILLQLRPVVASRTQDIDFSEPESVTWKPSPTVPLQFVRYEGGTAQSVQIGIYFTVEVDYEVQRSSDARSITLILPKAEAVPQQLPVPAPAIAPPADAQPAPGPRSITAPAVRPNLDGRYVLNLESSIQPLQLPTLPTLSTDQALLLYATQSEVDSRLWNRLRLGFFSTKDEALAIQRQLQAQFPRAWIATAAADERQQAATNGILLGSTRAERPPVVAPPKPGKVAPPIAQPVLPALPAERMTALMEEARQAMATNDYRRAVQLYTKILEHEDTGQHQDAQEFLALARERNGQIAHAKMEYERYLERYPEGPGADRVRQRLAGLITARQTPKERLRTVERGQEKPTWETHGSFSQFYRRDISQVEDEDSIVNQSSLSTDLDVNARRRGGDLDIQTRFSGGYEHDFLDDGPGSLSRLSSLYVDVQDRKHDVGMRLGRQTRSTGGVLGRFDGALLSFQVKPTVKLNAVSGFPVDSSKDSLETNRYFYGVSADFGTYANAWDFVAFLIEQQVDGILDRRAVGGEARYFDPVKSVLTYVDYDISYDELNTLLILGNWNLANQMTINATIDYRQSPILTTRNAIQGQGVETIDELTTTFTEDELRQLAQDRTATSTSYTLGVAKPLSERFQVTGDVTMSNLGSTPTSAGVEGMPSTGDEFFYNLQLIGSNLLKEGDVTILGVRYSDTSTSNTTSLLVNSRYPVNSAWRVNPRVRLDYRENLTDESTQWTAAPSLLLDYRWRRKYRLEFEAGGEWSSRELVIGTEDSTAYYFNLGYRADF